jgi:hypothetical protein
MPDGHPSVPAAILRELRTICTELPETYEEAAWVGVRWMVRKKNFAHVLMIKDSWPPEYSRVAGTPGPACVLTFRSMGRAHEPPSFDSTPFFRPPWFANIVGMTLDTRTDWDRVGRLLVTSYRVLAPKKLVALLE